jgi:hypothetical protein
MRQRSAADLQDVFRRRLLRVRDAGVTATFPHTAAARLHRDVRASPIGCATGGPQQPTLVLQLALTLDSGCHLRPAT